MKARIQRLLGIKHESEIDGKIHAAGTTVPTDATYGYEPGCIFSHIDGGTGTALYVNEGTLNSCAFKAVPSVDTAQAIIQIPPNSWIAETGDPLVIYASASDGVPRLSSLDEAWGIRWNNDGTPLAICTQVAIPPDLDETADVVFHLLAGKTGATGADEIIWTLAAFNNTVGALYDADADFGGAAAAMVGDATAKTVAERTVTLAAADVAAAPCSLQLTLVPSDMATDDVILLSTWIEYQRKALTS